MKKATLFIFVILCMWGLVHFACSTSDGGPVGRVTVVHNALQAIGFSELGEMTEGTLEQGRSQELTFDFEEGGCYVFVALGSDTVQDIDLELLSPDGEQLASDETTDRQAVLQVCAENEGEYTVTLTMESGQGGYVLGHWSGGDVELGGSSGRSREPEGTCGNPIDLEFGETVSGSTVQATDQSEARCVPGRAPDVAYEFTLDESANVCLDMTATYDGALVLQSECGQVQSEIACNDDMQDTRHSSIRERLEPGTYYVLTSGYGEGRGNYSLTAAVAETPEPAQACKQAQALPVGRDVTGTTAGCLADAFQASCANGARSAERIYSLRLNKRSRVRIETTTNSHDGALYLRRTCTDAASEIVCNDDYRNTNKSLITSTLDPGTYYVFVDGYGDRQQGPFRIRAQTASLGGGAVPGDACSNAQPLSAGRVQGSTMTANADLSGSCARQSQDAPDLVYALNLTENTQVKARMIHGDMRAVMYLQSKCGQATSEIACSGRSSQFSFPSIEKVLNKGSYYLVVDGLDQNEFGDFELDIQMRSTKSMTQECRQAKLLRPNAPAKGTTSGSDDFHASCAGGARSPEAIYRLQLPRRQRVRLSLDASYDGALYIRRTCIDESTEVACNDDFRDRNHSQIETTLDRGTYYVFVDGFSTSQQGRYTLRVELQNP